MAGVYNFQIVKGEDFVRVLTHKDSAGVAVNNTGYTALLEARINKSDASPLITLSVGSGITLGGATGKYTIRIEDTVTATYTFNTLSYNFWVTPPSGDKRKLLTGYITLV